MPCSLCSPTILLHEASLSLFEFAGELSPGAAWLLCLTLAAGGVSIVAKNFGTLITSLYSFGLFLGTIYSVPPLRYAVV
jgi:hypothetical protein